MNPELERIRSEMKQKRKKTNKGGAGGRICKVCKSDVVQAHRIYMFCRCRPCRKRGNAVHYGLVHRQRNQHRLFFDADQPLCASRTITAGAGCRLDTGRRRPASCHDRAGINRRGAVPVYSFWGCCSRIVYLSGDDFCRHADPACTPAVKKGGKTYGITYGASLGRPDPWDERQYGYDYHDVDRRYLSHHRFLGSHAKAVSRPVRDAERHGNGCHGASRPV